ncbi:sulfur carrier protein ThiS [Hyphomicrobium sulfonivorans]|uniref:sulfur carrier protein ThiS n=1 Tax=Hyphomicrobium sulfonivorans TaxID=121290 RepID=UPI00157027D4|nr:sulfur carrier protein ThiS [Hyphomicrobium sulfonivorans]MBI1649541.1 sulfur carrier protein ThiS [Hyphomicrobium sulfonivorans]NSL71457.1 thiamine biosynthesis protein ThiS [Hyphomicrobium sulfonivorans]
MDANIDNRGDACRAVEIVVNGEATATAAPTLFDLVAERGLADVRVATARNGDFIPERARAETRLQAGDRIEILSARHGG